MAKFKTLVPILSGKGGVGKTTISCNIAYMLSKKYPTGLLDVDISTPNVPVYFNLTQPLAVHTDWRIDPLKYENLEIYSVGAGLPKDVPIHWDGQKIQRYIMQCFVAVNWSKLDYLVLDCPPTTSDEFMVLERAFADVGQAILVGVSEDMAIADMVRVINMCRKLDIDILGVIENFAYHQTSCCSTEAICAKCGKIHTTYDRGKLKTICSGFGLKYLGELPFNPLLNRGSSAKQFVDERYSVFSRVEEELEKIKPRSWIDILKLKLGL